MDKSFVLSFDYDAENRSEASDSRLNLERYNIESDSYNIKLMLVSRIMVNSEWNSSLFLYSMLKASSKDYAEALEWTCTNRIR